MALDGDRGTFVPPGRNAVLKSPQYPSHAGGGEAGNRLAPRSARTGSGVRVLAIKLLITITKFSQSDTVRRVGRFLKP
jgi:hypothetical protein